VSDRRIDDGNGLESPPLGELANRLDRDRLAPTASFELHLRRSLLEPTSIDQRRLRISIAACVSSGALLLAVVALGLAGVGPLAAA
jgi:hypothetical protein